MVWLKYYVFTKALPVFYMQKIDTLDIDTYNKYLGEMPSSSGQVLKELLSEVGSENLITFDGTPLPLEWSTPRTRHKKRRWGSDPVFLVSDMGMLPSFASMITWLWANYFFIPSEISLSICSNLLNNGSKFWQQSLINSIQECLNIWHKLRQKWNGNKNIQFQTLNNKESDCYQPSVIMLLHNMSYNVISITPKQWWHLINNLYNCFKFYFFIQN